MDENCNRDVVDSLVVEITEEQEPGNDDQDCLCPVCRGELIKPRVTKCGHVFCKRCLHAVKERQLICPICRAQLEPETFLADGRLGTLPNLAHSWVANKQPDRLMILFGFTILVAFVVVVWYGIKKLFVTDEYNLI